MGAAVGLGSIWKLPCEVDENGGGAFVLIHLAGLLLIVLPLMLAEFAVGWRCHGRHQPVGRGSRLGALMLAGGLGILRLYSVIGGNRATISPGGGPQPWLGLGGALRQVKAAA